MGPDGQLRTQQSRASGAGYLSRYGRFCGTNKSAITSGGTWGFPRGAPGSLIPGVSPEGPREVSEASWIPQDFFSITGSVSWVHRFFFSNLKMSKNVENHKNPEIRRENRFKARIWGARIITFSFDIQDPTEILWGSPLDPQRISVGSWGKRSARGSERVVSSIYICIYICINECMCIYTCIYIEIAI